MAFDSLLTTSLLQVVNRFVEIDCQNLLSTDLLQVVSTSCKKEVCKWQVVATLILTDILQFDDIQKLLQRVVKIDILQQVCGVFHCSS